MSEKLVLTIFSICFHCGVIALFPLLFKSIKYRVDLEQCHHRRERVKLIEKYIRFSSVVFPPTLGLLLSSMFGAFLLAKSDVLLWGMIIVKAEQKTPLLMLVCALLVGMFFFMVSKKAIGLVDKFIEVHKEYV